MRVLLIGHVSDDLRFGTIIKGGPVLYQSPVFLALGAQVDVITAAHNPSELPTFNRSINYFVIPSPSTTTFKFTMVGGQKTSKLADRRLQLVNKAKLITADFILQNAAKTYDVVVVSPIVNEMDKNAMQIAAGLGTNSHLDLQGLVRNIHDDGTVSNKLQMSDLQWALKTFSVVKLSNNEFDTLENFSNDLKSVLIITKGGYGYEILTKSAHKSVKTIPIENTIDTTGSGDIFLAAFSYFFPNYSIEESILLADKYARVALSHRGIPTVKLFQNI